MKKILIIGCIISIISISMILNKSYNTYKEVNIGDNKVNLALSLDGSSISDVPSKGNYSVDVSCENATGKWDYNSWKLLVNNIKNANIVCSLDFTTVNPADNYLNNKVTSLVGNGQVFNEEVVIDNSSFEITSQFESNQYANITNDTTYPYTWDASAKTWTSTNHTNSKTSTFIFSPSTAGNYGFCYIQSSEKNYDYARVYINNTEKINLKGISNTSFECQYLGNLSSADQIKVTYQKDSSSSSGTDNIIFYLSNGTYNENIETVNADIRYEGMNPDNYVWFNSELWRIIGVFDDTTHGVTGESLVKIIRDESLGGLVWGKSNENNWATSSLMNLLNGAYLNQEDGTNGNYCYGYSTSAKAHCDYREKGISDEYRNMIETRVVWKLGGIASDSNTAASFYTAERGTTVYGTNATVWPNSSGASYPIGLMYASDYAYAVPASSCARTTDVGSYNNANCTLNNWLYGEGNEWTLTHDSSDSRYAFYVLNYGYAGSNSAYYGSSVRPVLYLKSSAWVISGDGSEANPYILGA